jgi:hypothetical protein
VLPWLFIRNQFVPDLLKPESQLLLHQNLKERLSSSGTFLFRLSLPWSPTYVCYYVGFHFFTRGSASLALYSFTGCIAGALQSSGCFVALSVAYAEFLAAILSAFAFSASPCRAELLNISIAAYSCACFLVR